MESSAHQDQLHILFFPFLAQGHILPLVDMARLLAERGVRATIATTPGNVFCIRHIIDEVTRSGHSMQILLLPFPSADVGLPHGCENTTSLPPSASDLEKFYRLLYLLQQPLEQLLRDHCPDCIISDALYPWTTDLALSLGIPRIVFHGTTPFSLCISDNVESHDAHLAVSADNEPFVVPGGLPHKILLTRSELPKTFTYPKLVLEIFREAELKSYGLVFNSFDELAPQYVELCKMGGKKKVWCIGPVWLCNRTDADKAERGGKLHSKKIHNHEQGERIKNWLDSKEPESVLYVCFGSECIFNHDQLHEIASGLEASGHLFLWVVRGHGGGAETTTEWLPEGFEKRVEGKGLILRGWAPQVLILNHPAIGGFMMHCGWNSTIEAVSTGVPMIAWPLHSEQFINERLIVQVLGIGLSALEAVRRTIEVEKKEVVSWETVREVVTKLMGSAEGARLMRRRVKEYKKMARSAMEEGGSSYVNLSRLLEELNALKQKKG